MFIYSFEYYLFFLFCSVPLYFFLFASDQIDARVLAFILFLISNLKNFEVSV